MFSDGLGIDEQNTLVGSGQYLVLEDIFVSESDTLLPAGTYTAIDTITDIVPFTFLKGKTFEEKTYSDKIYSGAYLNYFETDATKNAVKYIVSGTFTVTYSTQGTCTLSCDFVTNDKKELKGTFTGDLIYFDESAKVKAGMPRERRVKALK